jgi:sortase A
VGLIAIPELKIHLPIFEGDEEEQLRQGAGISGNSNFESDNFSIAAHQVFGGEETKSWLFSPLTQAKAGMEVFIASEKNVYKYIISESLTVDVHDTYVLDAVEGQRLLTMIYCPNFTGDERTIVRAVFDSSKPLSEANQREINYLMSNWNLIPEEI